MRKGPGSAYDKWNVSMVICDTAIQPSQEECKTTNFSHISML